MSLESKYWKFVYLLVFFILLFTSAELLNLRDDFSLDNIKQTIQQNSVTGFILFVLLFALGNFIQIPGLLFLVAAVVTLGKFQGGMVTYAAAIISCVISFVVIRLLGGDILRNFKHSWANKVFHQLDEKPIKSIFILRSVFQTLPLLNYGLALSGVSFKNHLVATLIALPLPIFIYCVFIDEVAMYLGL
ncbi:MAG: TVP38/TMEM64 family protein [Kangiellaceae bacterium]